MLDLVLAERYDVETRATLQLKVVGRALTVSPALPAA